MTLQYYIIIHYKTHWKKILHKDFSLLLAYRLTIENVYCFYKSNAKTSFQMHYLKFYRKLYHIQFRYYVASERTLCFYFTLFQPLLLTETLKYKYHISNNNKVHFARFDFKFVITWSIEGKIFHTYYTYEV